MGRIEGEGRGGVLFFTFISYSRSFCSFLGRGLGGGAWYKDILLCVWVECFFFFVCRVGGLGGADLNWYSLRMYDFVLRTRTRIVRGGRGGGVGMCMCG